jgi:hypothetical protein
VGPESLNGVAPARKMRFIASGLLAITTFFDPPLTAMLALLEQQKLRMLPCCRDCRAAKRGGWIAVVREGGWSGTNCLLGSHPGAVEQQVDGSTSGSPMGLIGQP